MPLRLIVEKPAPEEQFEYILEEKDRNTPATLFIRGPYMMANGVNRNKRLYPLEEMTREVARYTDEMIKTGRAMGELNHPTNADVNHYFDVYNKRNFKKLCKDSILNKTKNIYFNQNSFMSILIKKTSIIDTHTVFYQIGLKQ